MISIGLSLSATRIGESVPPAPPETALLNETHDWEVPGIYGLDDDGSGSWVWASTPDYVLYTSTLEWGAA